MATLIRIANEKYKNQVSHKQGFSLNGGVRNTSYIGQTSLARKINKTYFTRYQGPSGNGGKLGKYFVQYTKKSRCCNNNNNIIKNSVINTKGMLSQRNKWMNSTYPNIVVQPDSNYPLNSSSSSHTQNIANKTISNGMNPVYSNDNTHERKVCVFSNETININNKASDVRLNKLAPCSTIRIFPPRLNNSLCHSLKK